MVLSFVEKKQEEGVPEKSRDKALISPTKVNRETVINTNNRSASSNQTAIKEECLPEHSKKQQS